jgi:integrase
MSTSDTDQLSLSFEELTWMSYILPADTDIQSASDDDHGPTEPGVDRAADAVGEADPPSASDPADPRLTTLADVLAWQERKPSRGRRHTEMKRALRKMGEALRGSLADIPADATALRKLIAAVSPAAVGMSKAEWSRARSLVLACLRDAGLDLMPGRDVGGASPTWRARLEQLHSKAQRVGMSRFASHCTRKGIEPDDVCPETFDGFLIALRTKSLHKKPEVAYRCATRRWNEAVKTVPGWPQVLITLAADPRRYSLPWEDFPPSFVLDVEASLARSENPDVFAKDYSRPVKPRTVVIRRMQIRELASMLVASGFPVERITSLAVLVDTANATAALMQHRTHNDGVVTPSIGQKAWLLHTIAKYWVKSEQDAAELGKLAGRLSDKPKGMIPRNRERLRQFDLGANVDRLLQLPGRVLEEAQADERCTPAQARRVMFAAAVEILLVAPMRIGNLTGLEWDRHLIQVGHSESRNRHIVVPGAETKTGADFEMMLPPGSAALVDAYLETFRARVCATPSLFLFPNPKGGRRCTHGFSAAISKFVESETGITLHCHGYRHLVGKLHLRAHPEDVETVRRVLSHRSSATTLRSYTEQRTDQAFARYDATIADLRARVANDPDGAHRPSGNPEPRR